MSNFDVQFAAQQVVQAVHWNYHPDQIADAMRRMIVSLGGNLALLERLEPEGRLLYIIALVAAQP